MKMHNQQQKNDSHLLFVYGTLMRGYTLHVLLLQPDISYLGRGRIHAKLFALPGEDFPAAVPDRNAYTCGEVYYLGTPGTTLPAIDEAEGCAEGLFERQLISVWQNDKLRKAWTYFYKRSIANARPIPGGDYRTFASAP